MKPEQSGAWTPNNILSSTIGTSCGSKAIPRAVRGLRLRRGSELRTEAEAFPDDEAKADLADSWLIDEAELQANGICFKKATLDPMNARFTKWLVAGYVDQGQQGRENFLSLMSLTASANFSGHSAIANAFDKFPRVLPFMIG